MKIFCIITIRVPVYSYSVPIAYVCYVSNCLSLTCAI